MSDLTWRPLGRGEPILSHVSFTIEPGERVLLVGGSGSGKSTLLRALAGVLRTTESGDFSGRVTLTGTGDTAATAGLLLQDPSDAAVAGTAYRDAAFGLENQAIPPGDMRDLIDEILEAVTFPYPPAREVQALSGGEAQRLALAGVLVMRPGLVLLDEPTSMLDPVAADAVRTAIRNTVMRSGATVVVVEHHLDSWTPLMDRVLVLGRDGTLKADGPPQEVLAPEAGALQGDGIWHPGIPAPTPMCVPHDLCTPVRRTPPGSSAVTADRVGLTRTSSSPRLPGRRSTAEVLREVSVTVPAGEIVAVVGASGAGKSTLASLVAGLISPTTGQVTVHETLAVEGERRPDLWSAAGLASRVGWVPQNAELTVLGRTVLHDAQLTPGLLGGLDGRAENRIRELLSVLELDAVAHSDPHHLSGGELRRLALLIAVAHGPSILVLDEPTVGQDRDTWAAVVGVICAARDAGMAVLVTTHDPLLAALADRVITLSPRAGTPSSAEQSPVDGGNRSGGLDAGSGTRSPLWGRLLPSCGPLSLLGASLALLIGAFAIAHIGQGIAGISAWLVLFVFAARLDTVPWRRLIPGFLAVASVGFSTWLLSPGQDVAVGVTAGVRIAFFVIPGIYLAGLIDPSALGDHLAQRLRFPARPVIAATAALEQFENLAGQWHQLQQARRIRGLGGSRSPLARIKEYSELTGALLVQALYKAGRMSVAMEARGFSTSRPDGAPRTWAAPAPWHTRDTILIGAAVLIAIVPALIGL